MQTAEQTVTGGRLAGDYEGSAAFHLLARTRPAAVPLCSADVYAECPDWAALGYCAWIWVITDPDTSEVTTVPGSCQDSCAVCGAPSPAAAAPATRRRRGRSLLGRRDKKSAGSQEPQLSNVKVKGGDSWRVRRGQVQTQITVMVTASRGRETCGRRRWQW